MGSTGSISVLATSLRPALAILRYDLRILASSWLVRLWLAGSGALTLLLLAAGWKQQPTAPLIALLLFPYLVFPWFLVVMVLGVEPVSGARLEALADGILSRPVTRYEYLLGSWAARLALVLGGYLVVVVPAVVWVTAASRRGVLQDHVTVYGVLAALGLVGLVLILQVSLGYLLGTLLRRPLLAIVVLLFVWYPSDLILHQLSLEQFSTISLNQAMPRLLRTPWRTPRTTRPGDRGIQDIADRTAQFLGFLGNGPPVAPERKRDFFERGNYQDFSLIRAALGYSVPTVLVVGLTLLSFCYRDM